jgi:tRNA(fMet)-specific endonuclease VapC|tara:strand:- start:47 stop:445 length:399 start_codon:yes stop_codon:yes gene_type:complete
VGRTLILETTFLIDLEREHNRARPGAAVAFLEANGDARLYLPFIVAGELAAGASLADRARWEAFLGPFYVLASNADVCWKYGRAYRYLQEQGRLIGGNDLWIAATGLAYDMPVVTRNAAHYRRVPGLDVEEY